MSDGFVLKGKVVGSVKAQSGTGDKMRDVTRVQVLIGSNGRPAKLIEFTDMKNGNYTEGQRVEVPLEFEQFLRRNGQPGVAWKHWGTDEGVKGSANLK
jgi:hypothetical protein